MSLSRCTRLPKVATYFARLKLLLHMGLRLKIGVLIDGIVDQQLIRGFEKPFDVQDFVRVSFLPMRLFELNFRNIKLLFACFFNLSFKMCCTKKNILRLI